MDCVGDESSSQLRDFAGKCLCEFLRWSMKSVDKAEVKSQFNAKSLFKRLYSIAKHPNPFKRLGAAVTMKRLYRVFREDRFLVDEFILEILDTMLTSLQLADNDAESAGTVLVIQQVCEALGRIIVPYKDMLLKRNKLRFTPLPILTSSLLIGTIRRRHQDLESFVKFVFSHIGSPTVALRNSAFSLFHSAPNFELSLV